MSLFKTTGNPKSRLVIDVSNIVSRLSILLEKLTKPIQIVYSVKDENLFFVMGQYYQVSQNGVDFKNVKLRVPKDIDEHNYIVTDDLSTVDINQLKSERHEFNIKEDVYTHWFQLIKVVVTDYLVNKFPIYRYPEAFVQKQGLRAKLPVKDSLKRMGHYHVEPGEVHMFGNAYVSNDIELYVDLFPDLFHSLDAYVGEDVWNEYQVSLEKNGDSLSIVVDKKEDFRIIDFHLRLSDSFNQYVDEQERQNNDESQRLYVGERRIVYECGIYSSAAYSSKYPPFGLSD